MKLVLGKWATDRVASVPPPNSPPANHLLSLQPSRRHGGIILLGPDGRFGFAHNTPAMAWGLATPPVSKPPHHLAPAPVSLTR